LNEKIKILIADDNLDFVNRLTTYFKTQEDVEVIATARDGQEAYNKIIMERPQPNLKQMAMICISLKVQVCLVTSQHLHSL